MQLQKKIKHSYDEIKKTYDKYKELRRELGMPRRTIFNTEAIRGDVQGTEFFESIKQLREEKRKV
jgi:hypothetical protein